MLALAQHLPHGAATWRAIHGDAADWSIADHLLAAAVDALNAGNWQRGGGKGSRPGNVSRPRSKAKDEHTLDRLRDVARRRERRKEVAADGS